MPQLAYVYDDIFLKHVTPAMHPESPSRLTAIQHALQHAPFFAQLLPVGAPSAALADVALVHEERYIQTVAAECAQGAKSLSTGDSAICPASYDVALHAVGGVLAAVDAVMQGTVQRAFCAVRPPGHHASAARGMGFCLFNNIAIAARYAQKKYSISRVLIADWDVHHGNGTQDIFFADGSVMFFSTHQWPLYPGTGLAHEAGAGAGQGLIINRPFWVGAGNSEIVGAFQADLLPAATWFKPELTLISAGFDSRQGDPLGGFHVDDDGYRQLTRIMLDIAAIAGHGRLISILEGGYNLAGLASAVSAHVETLVQYTGAQTC